MIKVREGGSEPRNFMKCCMCGKTFVLLLLHTCTALATSCHQVYPSEYAYEDGSVAEQESIIANCRRYQKGLQEGVFTAQYTHCNGIQLKLRDSDLGQQQCQTADYYVWLAGSAEQLLFIFPTRVSLTIPSHCTTTVAVSKALS